MPYRLEPERIVTSVPNSGTLDHAVHNQMMQTLRPFIDLLSIVSFNHPIIISDDQWSRLGWPLSSWFQMVGPQPAPALDPTLVDTVAFEVMRRLDERMMPYGAARQNSGMAEQAQRGALGSVAERAAAMPVARTQPPPISARLQGGEWALNSEEDTPLAERVRPRPTFTLSPDGQARSNTGLHSNDGDIEEEDL